MKKLKITPSSIKEKNILSMEQKFFKNINPTHYYDVGKYFLALDYARDELV